MANTISAISSSLPPVALPPTTLPESSSTAGLANQSTFLKLLVTQLKNQDPTKPADSTQFVTQLAQFSQLESLQNINKNVMKLAQDSVTKP